MRIKAGTTQTEEAQALGFTAGQGITLALVDQGVPADEADLTISTAWQTLSKAANEARQSTDTLANDATLLFPVAASTKYRVRGRVFFDTTAAADFKYGFAVPASPTLVRIVRSDTVAGGTPAEIAVDVANVTTVTLAGTGTTGGYVAFEYLLHNGTTAGTWSFQWAQGTSTAADTTVLAGSYIEYSIA
jgi:hypothetical protein